MNVAGFVFDDGEHLRARAVDAGKQTTDLRFWFLGLRRMQKLRNLIEICVCCVCVFACKGILVCGKSLGWHCLHMNICI